MNLDEGYVPQDPNNNTLTLFTLNASGSLSINAPVENSQNATFGDINLITPLPNPNMNGDLVLPVVQVGGTLMATDIILGNNGSTKLISDSTGTYIYNNLNVNGTINNPDLTNKLSAKAKIGRAHV